MTKRSPNQGCAALAAWMVHSRRSAIGALPIPDPGRANVPVTRRDGAGEPLWYLHLLPTHEDEAVVCRVPQPSSVSLLRTGESLGYRYQGDKLHVALAPAHRTGLDDVVAVTWSREPDP